jgi:hypothetical protein
MKRCLAVAVAVLVFGATPASAVNHDFIPADEASDSPMAGGNNAVACEVGKACPKSGGKAQGEANASFTR